MGFGRCPAPNLKGGLMFDGEMRIDNTMRKNAAQCKRKFQLANILGVQSSKGSTALRYGATWHGFQEGFYSGIKEAGWAQREHAIEAAILRGKSVWDKESAAFEYYDDYRTLENCAHTFLQYIQHYAHDEGMLEVIETEQVFALELTRDTDFERYMFTKIPRIIFTGKIDLQANINDNFWIIEHKTTGQNPNFIATRLHRNTAVIGYSYAAERVLQKKPEGVLVSIAQTVSRKSPTTGLYGKLTIDFARTPQLFTDADFEKWKHSFLRTCRDIYDCWQDAYFPAEFDRCYDYNKLCAYSRICETNKSIPLDPEQASALIDNTPGYIIKLWNVEDEEGE
jgi:hypothetical protein